MKAFTQLYVALDQTNKTIGKIAAMESYFRSAPPNDAAWAVYFLSGRKLKQLIPTKLLRLWTIEKASVSPWLFDECYEVVGDLAETMALVLPDVEERSCGTLSEWMERLVPLRKQSMDEQRDVFFDAWGSLTTSERFVFHKIITGAFRIGVSQSLLVRGLAQASGVATEAIAHRLMGSWEPTASFYESLIHPEIQETQISRPYPFYLAHPLEDEPTVLGEINEWQVEWKWDGIRATVIHRNGEVFIWSRGEELITERFPEIAAATRRLPQGIVLDGEILAWRDDRVLPFGELQKRIGRKNLTKRIMQDVPVCYMAFDCLEFEGQDRRESSLSERRNLLEKTIGGQNGEEQMSVLRLSPLHVCKSWEQLMLLRSRSRDYGTEGLMLKRKTSPYRVGRPRGDWWKWKIEPYTVDAVLIYAQSGHGKRASLFTDYTFAVWDHGKLVPFAKAYSGLDDNEIRQVDAYVKRATIERFGPVRSVKPELVFELAFEDIRESSRHKSGIAVRFPRILRWRKDKAVEEADSLETIRAMIRSQRVS